MGNIFVNFKQYIKLNRGGGYPSLQSSAQKRTEINGLKKKRILLFSILFLFVFTPLFSSSIEWYWSTDDTAVKYYRYKTSTSRSGWTVVESTTTSFITDDTVKSIELQASYDGIVWSESAYCTFVREEEKTVCTCNALLWTWDTSDEEVKYFRYQLDCLESNGWTVVGGNVMERKLPAHEGLNTLYVEASYDGENWSTTTAGTYIYEPQLYRTRKWEVTMNLLPYLYQRINYTIENTPSSRASVYGGGAGIELRYNFSPTLSLCSSITTEHYKYDGFHIYHDFKLTSSVDFKIIGGESSRDKLYLTLGGGMDFVVRDDGEYGCYPLVSYGLKNTFNLTARIALGLSLTLNHTFQNGSNVMNVRPSIFLSYSWGCKAGCRVSGGECR